jgi:maleylpyruvate isomerase
MRPTTVIEECRHSHQRFLGGVVGLDDERAGEASRLPRYSRANVIAHVTNKAKAHRVLFEGAVAGEVRRLHPEGHDPDLAARRPAGTTVTQLRAELEESFAALEAAWASLDDQMWARHGVMMAGPRTMAEIVGHHWRNVEVHHVDLDIGYEPDDWPSAFVDGELSRRLKGLPERASHPELLAWLLGRAPAPDLSPW